MMKRSVSRFLGMALTGCLAAAGVSLLSASDVSAASYPSEFFSVPSGKVTITPQTQSIGQRMV